MKKVAVVTDSTAYIPKELVEQYNIQVAPQVLIWGNETLLDGVDIQPNEFYSRLKTAKIMPSTSQASVKSFNDIYKTLLDQGYQVLAIVLSAKLSGTMASAVQAKDLFPGAPIEIIDSYTTAMAMGFQVLSVARAASEGATLEQCVTIAEEARKHTGVVFAVDTLEFLHRGGRIGNGTRLLGTALTIKPIFEISDGLVEPLEKVRTRKKSLARLVEIMVEQVGTRKPVHLATLHANAPEDAKWLLDEASKRVNICESVYSTVSPVVGTHAGPGTVGLAWMIEH